MGEKTLIIFIDSLPYFCTDRMKFLSRFKSSIRKVIPGFGYSINVKAQIFCGATPDEVGYLNEWTYTPQGPLRKYHLWLRALTPLQRFYYLDRIAHKLFSKLYRQNLLNIPFEYLSFFARTGTEPYRDEFSLPTIFSEMNNLRKICYYHYRYGEKRDHQIYFNTMKVISQGAYDNIFVAFGDLDGVTHKYGVGTKEYNRKTDEMDNYLCQMHKEFISKNPNGAFLIISDHGMANVTGAVHINMERKFGRASESSYLYFVDSTMLRIWTFGERKKFEIEKCLNGLTFGKVLSKQERINYGITSRAFGDIIFLLNEGLIFNPSFMGRKMPKSMHGYRPELESQQGIFLNIGGYNIEDERIRTIDLYSILQKIIR